MWGGSGAFSGKKALSEVVTGNQCVLQDWMVRIGAEAMAAAIRQPLKSNVV